MKAAVGSVPALVAALEKEHGVSMGAVVGLGDAIAKAWFSTPPSEMAPFRQKKFGGGARLVFRPGVHCSATRNA